MKKNWLLMALMTLILLFPVNSFADSLQELQDIAVQNRKIIDKYKQQVQIAKKDIRIARSGYLPSIDAAYVLNSLNKNTPSGEGRENSIITGSITYNVFAGFRDKYNIEAANQIHDAEQLKVESVIQDIKHAVAIYFTDIYVKRSAASVSEKIYDLYTQLYKDALNKFDEGLLNKSDLLKTKVEQDNALIGLERAKANLEIAVNELERAIDTSVQLESLVFNNFSTAPRIAPIVINKEIMLLNRSDIKMLKKLIAASNAQVNAARSSYYPSVNIDGIYKRYDDHYLNGCGDYTDTYDDELRAQVTVSMNLFDGMAKGANVGKARANENSLQYDLYELQQSHSNNLMNYYLDFNVSQRNIIVTETGIEQAKENVRIAELSAEEGIITTSELLDTVANLARAEMNNIAATSVLFLSYYNIKRTIESY